MNIGELLENRQTTIKYIAFQQDGATDLEQGSSFRNLRFIEGTNVDILDENGNCIDANANTVINDFGDTQCICKLGFVASNGGRVQNEYDSCVRCIFSAYCFFEGDPCTDNDECDMGVCEGNECKANVSEK